MSSTRILEAHLVHQGSEVRNLRSKRIMASTDNDANNELSQDNVLNTYTTIECSSAENKSKRILAFRNNDSENVVILWLAQQITCSGISGLCEFCFSG